jgi:hypothetical protein
VIVRYFPGQVVTVHVTAGRAARWRAARCGGDPCYGGTELRGCELLCSMHLSTARARPELCSPPYAAVEARRDPGAAAPSRSAPPAPSSPAPPTPSSSPATGGGQGARVELAHARRRWRPRARTEVDAQGREVSRVGFGYGGLEELRWQSWSSGDGGTGAPASEHGRDCASRWGQGHVVGPALANVGPGSRQRRRKREAGAIFPSSCGKPLQELLLRNLLQEAFPVTVADGLSDLPNTFSSRKTWSRGGSTFCKKEKKTLMCLAACSHFFSRW